jgi:hypothetical protein
MLSKEILNKLEQFIVTPACRVALRLKFYLWSFRSHTYPLLLRSANMILLLNPSGGYNLLLKRNMVSLSYGTVRYIQHSSYWVGISRTASFPL